MDAGSPARVWIGQFVFGTPSPAFSMSLVGIVAVEFVRILVLGGPLGEELGWRGFALPRMQYLRTPFAATLALGVIVAAWHLPLLAISESSNIAWEMVREHYWPRSEGEFVFNSDTPSPDKLEVWREWMTAVFMPANRRAAEVIVIKSHLLVDDEMPGCSAGAHGPC